ncbi:MAG: tyrosine recombinase XerC [Calditrichaceae bacterium]|nr:tyrosine recombinase XerC [Calditrichaceae bacterium]MBN2708334.1 tyrosine recombinase XerC [Calditrichaceae bacterium]RQV95223.1 MAG: tyrosine recombinase XerC [Calditrichota bacterium]
MNSQIRQFLKYLALERHYSNHTLKSYTTDLLQFEEYLQSAYRAEKVFWHLINRNTLRGFLVYLQEEGLSLRSVGRKLATVKSFFKYLAREEIIPKNPAATIKMPKFDKKLPEFISTDEIEKVFKTIKGTSFEDIRDLCILELFYGTGMRLSELINIKVSDIYFKENLIRLIGKGNKERIVPFGSFAKRILEKYMQFRTQIAPENVDNIFVLKNGKKMYPAAIQRLVKKYLATASSTHKKSPHILRHTFATHLLNKGASIRVVKDLLGHESLSTTQVYTHISIDHLKKVYNQTHPGSLNKSKSKLRRS